MIRVKKQINLVQKQLLSALLTNGSKLVSRTRRLYADAKQIQEEHAGSEHQKHTEATETRKIQKPIGNVKEMVKDIKEAAPHLDNKLEVHQQVEEIISLAENKKHPEQVMGTRDDACAKEQLKRNLHGTIKQTDLGEKTHHQQQ